MGLTRFPHGVSSFGQPLYGGDAPVGWETGDSLIYYDGSTPIESEIYGVFTDGLMNLAADQSSVTIGTVTTNTDMRGNDDAALASVCTEARMSLLEYIYTFTHSTIPNQITAVDTVVDAILVDTETTIPGLINTLITGVTVASMDADSLTASALKADAVTEIQNGLATSAALAVVDSNVDAILVDTNETIPALIAENKCSPSLE